MQHNCICAEQESSSYSWVEYTRRSILGKKLNVSHFKIFGSSIYYHVTKDERKPLEPTTELGIFVGYTDTPHNYRVYLPSHRMIMVHNVNFHELKVMRCSLERELELHADEELLAPKEEPHNDVEHPHVD